MRLLTLSSLAIMAALALTVSCDNTKHAVQYDRADNSYEEAPINYHPPATDGPAKW